MRRNFKRTSGVNCKKKQLITIRKNDEFKKIEIRSKNNNCLWSSLLEYLSKMNIGDRFTRKDLLMETYEEPSAIVLYSSCTTIDTYLTYLKRLSIVKAVERGVYEKNFNIPKDTTLSLIRNILSKKEWEKWFIPLHKSLGLTKEEFEK